MKTLKGEEKNPIVVRTETFYIPACRFVLFILLRQATENQQQRSLNINPP